MTTDAIVLSDHPVNADGKPICGAKKSGGGVCKLAAGHGTEHPGIGRCKWHFGATPAVTQAAAKQEAREYAAKLLGSSEGDADPDVVLMKEVTRAENAVKYFDREIAKLIAEGEDSSTKRFSRVMWNWNEQRRLLTYVSNLVVRAGIAKRSIEIQEMQAAAVLSAVLSVLSAPELALDPERIEFARRQVASNLRDLAMGAEQRSQMIHELARPSRV